ncbi:putative response regulatory protein ypdB [Fibrella aestuarina BUZ 2]|uniref:Putative response regulatory protein ypdB n=1 Tax=Fibrella aestuarina BUZ 2 TaxID=1166018 RepID=I0K961_9BACT|nr:putative response regulatory protein ypdB [Fibrella aestuarina BUZ 2]
MMQAIALDDERPALEVIEAFCQRLDTVQLDQTFTRLGDARTYLAQQRVDLLFLDINMPAGSGIEFVRSLQPAPLVIFTTAYSDYAVTSYELSAVDYLLKPFTFDRFRQAVDKAWQQHQRLTGPLAPEAEYVVFRVDYSLIRVALADIVFVEGLDNYLKIHFVGAKPIVVRLTMKAMIEKLPTDRFVRIHRSFIVALARVRSVRNKLIAIGDEDLPLSSTYERDFFALFDKE